MTSTDLASTSPRLVDQIRELAAGGDSDAQIGAALGFTRSWIGEVRRTHKIAAGTSQRGLRVYSEVDPAELARLRDLAARQYFARPRYGPCYRCRRLYPLAGGRVVPHPKLGTTPQHGRPCAGSWQPPVVIDVGGPVPPHPEGAS